MRDLKLKYTIELVSNIGQEAAREAKLLEAAQGKMGAAVSATGQKLDQQGKTAVQLQGQVGAVAQQWLQYGKVTQQVTKLTEQTTAATVRLADVLPRTSNAVESLDQVITRVGHNTSIERQVGYMHALASSADAAVGRLQHMRQALANGLEKLPDALGQLGAGGYGAGRIMAPPIRAYSNLEAATQDLRVAMLDKSGQVSPDFGKISAEAVQLGNKLPGSTKDFMMGARALIEQGVPTSVIANGGLRASSYFGVLMGMDQYQSAETIAKMREAYALKDGELVQMADLMQRGRYAFGIKPEDFRMVAAYAAPTYNTMGLTGIDNARKLIALQGMAAQVGLESSSFGTNFSMMLTRLAQLDQREHRHSPQARQMRQAMADAGVKMDFYDRQGHFEGIENMLAQLAKLRALNPEKQQQVLTGLFGAEAARPAQILALKGLEQYRTALGRMDGQADLDQRITMKMDTFAAKLEALGGTVENAMAAIAKQTGQLLKPAMDKANDIVGGPLQGFFDRHPAAGTAALMAGGAGGAYSLWKAWGLGRALLGRLGGTAAASTATEGASLAWPTLEGAAAPAAAAGGASMLARGGLWGILAAELGSFGYAGYEYYKATHHDGVEQHLTPYARARLRALGTTGTAPDMLNLTAPGGAGPAAAPSAPVQIQLGEGKLAVDVHVHDDRTSVTATVQQPLPLVRIDAGGTNPAGYHR